ncbi:amino acid/amide ABC transporter ATP-binding protein 2, HAAT family [Desulfatibacillum alkenivorans DSM 16219]|jgi:branched-chain amino acid transport system ATP-binding protein|uniref:Amino acid/amide ABC transporter ATP-binding protein 2, HAAT family n=1 Tax=Desulfatibacillum alkenivorans DSM 16219 TaxID=1121393 RepID=A0A1M6F183_9BACT|nr:ABC transporter ATP-binding protein [Desulfatibacillum alkenivorans]SHI91494.1 amino acid/amide ABC transporter ATP-binding protein 2, HAAT family [Desulfatibacillum alkenivorans DSM 16219]
MLLDIKNLHVKYGNVEALHGIDIEVDEGEIVTLLGANGAGKTTTLNAISGLVNVTQGEIVFRGEALHKLPAHKVVTRKITQSPEGRRVFGVLTVQENLNLGAFTSKNKERVAKSLEWIYELFPRLAERRAQLAGTLSGGEQQMLAIGRALMSNPKLLLLDEPSLGLAPVLVNQIFKTVRQINQAGVTVMLVEQNARMALKLAHRGYVMEVGKIVMADSAQALLKNPDVLQAYLGGAE